MRLLGVDLGKVRIGLAVMDESSGLPRPLPALAARGSLKADAAQVAEVAAKESAEAVVLGVPLEMGEETRMSTVVRKFSDELNALGLTAHLVDESLTSAEAEAALVRAGLKASKRKRRIDSEAACRILERYAEESS